MLVVVWVSNNLPIQPILAWPLPSYEESTDSHTTSQVICGYSWLVSTEALEELGTLWKP